MRTSTCMTYLVVGCLVFGACGGGGGGGNDNTNGPSRTLTGVTVSGAPASLVPPGTAQLTANAVFSDGASQNVTATASWETSDAAVATVAGGVVTARAPGPVAISAVFQGVRGTANLTIAAANVRANPGGPYQTPHDQDITFSALGSTSSPFPIARYIWDCGQSVASDCTSESPTPTFRYRKCGITNRPPCSAGQNTARYTVRLSVIDTQGNSSTETTTVTVTNSY